MKAGKNINEQLLISNSNQAWSLIKNSLNGTFWVSVMGAIEHVIVNLVWSSVSQIIKDNI